MDVDRAGCRALVRRQDGVLARPQALDLGWTSGAIAHRLARGYWQVLLPGVLLTTSGTPTGRQRLRAALLLAGPGSGFTGATGARLLGLDVPAGHDVLVAVPHQRKIAVRAYRVGPGRLVPMRTTRPLDALDVDGLPVLPVARCVVDACLGVADVAAVRALVSQAVQRRRTDMHRLRAELAEAPQQGSAVLRQVLAEVGEGARSAAEAALLRALARRRLPPFRLNEDLFAADGRFLARPDVVVPSVRLAVEVDGARWHHTPERLVSDVERHTRLEAEGWTVLRYPAARVLAEPHAVAAEIALVAARLAGRAGRAVRLSS